MSLLQAQSILAKPIYQNFELGSMDIATRPINSLPHLLMVMLAMIALVLQTTSRWSFPLPTFRLQALLPSLPVFRIASSALLLCKHFLSKVLRQAMPFTEAYAPIQSRVMDEDLHRLKVDYLLTSIQISTPDQSKALAAALMRLDNDHFLTQGLDVIPQMNAVVLQILEKLICSSVCLRLLHITMLNCRSKLCIRSLQQPFVFAIFTSQGQVRCETNEENASTSWEAPIRSLDAGSLPTNAVDVITSLLLRTCLNITHSGVPMSLVCSSHTFHGVSKTGQAITVFNTLFYSLCITEPQAPMQQPQHAKGKLLITVCNLPKTMLEVYAQWRQKDIAKREAAQAAHKARDMGDHLWHQQQDKTVKFISPSGSQGLPAWESSIAPTNTTSLLSLDLNPQFMELLLQELLEGMTKTMRVASLQASEYNILKQRDYFNHHRDNEFYYPDFNSDSRGNHQIPDHQWLPRLQSHSLTTPQGCGGPPPSWQKCGMVVPAWEPCVFA